MLFINTNQLDNKLDAKLKKQVSVFQKTEVCTIQSSRNRSVSCINQSKFRTIQSLRNSSVSSTNQSSVPSRAQEAGQCHQPIRIIYHIESKKQVSVINQSKFRSIQSSRSRSVSSTNQNSVPHRVQEASQCHQPIEVPFHPELKKQVSVINQSEFCTT